MKKTSVQNPDVFTKEPLCRTTGSKYLLLGASAQLQSYACPDTTSAVDESLIEAALVRLIRLLVAKMPLAKDARTRSLIP